LRRILQDPAARETLVRMYAAIRTRLKDGEEDRVRPIPLAKLAAARKSREQNRTRQRR